MSLSVNHMEIVLFIDTINLYHRKSYICNTMLVTVSLEHLVEKATPVFLRRHRILGSVGDRIDKVAIIADNGILMFGKKFCNGAFNCCKYFLSCCIAACQSSKFNTNNIHIMQCIDSLG